MEQIIAKTVKSYGLIARWWCQINVQHVHVLNAEVIKDYSVSFILHVETDNVLWWLRLMTEASPILRELENFCKKQKQKCIKLCWVP